ncbi:MAG: hypothetical protein ABI867_15505 [Kofleriaceae bacterium]
MTECSVCNITMDNVEPATAETGICRECRDKLAVKPMGEARRPPVPCQRCNGLRFIRALPREFSGEWDRAMPMTVTYPVVVTRGIFGGASVQGAEPRSGIGRLELYICRGCGFVEWYCDQPADLPIGPQYMTQDIDYGATKPYR